MYRVAQNGKIFVGLINLSNINQDDIVLLDMSINANKCGIRVGSRFNSVCCNLTTLEGREIMWMDKPKIIWVFT